MPGARSRSTARARLSLESPLTFSSGKAGVNASGQSLLIRLDFSSTDADHRLFEISGGKLSLNHISFEYGESGTDGKDGASGTEGKSGSAGAGGGGAGENGTDGLPGANGTARQGRLWRLLRDREGGDSRDLELDVPAMRSVRRCRRLGRKRWGGRFWRHRRNRDRGHRLFRAGRPRRQRRRRRQWSERRQWG